jgi:hypothetical protein
VRTHARLSSLLLFSWNPYPRGSGRQPPFTSGNPSSCSFVLYDLRSDVALRSDSERVYSEVTSAWFIICSSLSIGTGYAPTSGRLVPKNELHARALTLILSSLPFSGLCNPGARPHPLHPLHNCHLGIIPLHTLSRAGPDARTTNSAGDGWDRREDQILARYGAEMTWEIKSGVMGKRTSSSLARASFPAPPSSFHTKPKTGSLNNPN